MASACSFSHGPASEPEPLVAVDAAAVRAAAERRGISLNRLASRAGIDYANLWRMLDAPSRRTRLANIEALAAELEVPATSLVIGSATASDCGAAGTSPDRPMAKLSPSWGATSPEPVASAVAAESLVASMAARGARDARVRDAVARIAEARRVVATMTPGPYTLVPRFAPVGPEDPSSLLGRGHSLFVGKFDHRRDAHAFAALPSLVMQLAADLEKAIDDANNARCAANLWQHLATDTVNAAKQARARQAIDDLAAHSQAIGWPDAMMPRDAQPARLAGEPS